MPAFEDAVNILKADRQHLQVVVPVASTVAAAVRGRIAGWPHRAHIIEDEQLKGDAFAAATVALACSGTVTTELALASAPMIIGYRIGALTYAILKRLIRTPWITLFNIAAGQFVAPEFVQHDCTGENLARALADRLDDPDLRARQIADQNAALEKMGRGGPDPSDAAADAVLKVLGRA
jgi:lipid-A-disaccharide synthase